jgi:hypothetical protein
VAQFLLYFEVVYLHFVLFVLVVVLLDAASPPHSLVHRMVIPIPSPEFLPDVMGQMMSIFWKFPKETPPVPAQQQQ